MKHTKIKTISAGILLAALFASAGCSKEDSVDMPSFEVTLPGSVFKVGEPVAFSLSGNPDIISFYSGEAGNAYEYKDKDRITPAEMTLSFTTLASSGTAGYPNPAMAPISYSTDFDGDYTEEGVRRATWTDISDNFKFPTDVGQSIPSGTMFIDDLFPADGRPLYFRFHYQVDKFDQSAAGGKGNGRTQVNIQNFLINGMTASGSTPVYDVLTSGWQCVLTPSYDDCPTANLPSMPGTSPRILLRSDFRPTQDRECWAVSGPLYRAEDVNTGPDMGVGIKTVSDPGVMRYEHTYTTPGTYTVTFVGANSNVYGRKEVVRQLTLTVVGDEGGITPPEYEPWPNP